MRLTARSALVCASLLAALGFSSVFGACSGSSNGKPRDGTIEPTPLLRTVEVRLEDGTIIAVEVADAPGERVQGLSDRDTLDPDSGMLFVWDEAGQRQLWMKGMRFALDFVWLDDTKRVTEVTADVRPQPGESDAELRRYQPAAPSRYVIELNAGAAARLGIEAGDTLTFDTGGG